jgi:hypothetical protein
MSTVSSRVRELVNDCSVSDHYGKWGALRADQRQTIRSLCDTCDMFEETADRLYIENKRLKEELALLKGVMSNGL